MVTNITQVVVKNVHIQLEDLVSLVNKCHVSIQASCTGYPYNIHMDLHTINHCVIFS